MKTNERHDMAERLLEEAQTLANSSDYFWEIVSGADYRSDSIKKKARSSLVSIVQASFSISTLALELGYESENRHTSLKVLLLMQHVAHQGMRVAHHIGDCGEGCLVPSCSNYDGDDRLCVHCIAVKEGQW